MTTEYLSNPDLEPISPILVEMVNELAEELVIKYNRKFSTILEQQKQQAFEEGRKSVTSQ